MSFFLQALPSFADDQEVVFPNGRHAILHDDFTWEYFEQPKAVVDTSTIHVNEIPSFLRGGIAADRDTLVAAVELYSQGWKFYMPRPKSAQAAWGNGDRRTTWWNGYWINEKTHALSKADPIKHSNGIYYGDNQDLKDTWRNGGSPLLPTKIEWLLSADGGVPPK
jgi:hypothetical protein